MRPTSHLIIGCVVAMVVTGCTIDDSSDDTAATTIATTATTTAPTVSTTVMPETPTTIGAARAIVPLRVVELPPPSDEWNPILAERIAGSSRPSAKCPPGTNPSTAKPINDERPEPGWVVAGAGAFDASGGIVVHVDVAGSTWLFDVCTNTWHDARPDGDPSQGIGPLVYDVDSTATVMMGLGNVAVYDATTNTWERRPLRGRGIDDATTRVGPIGAVYDPVSGLIVTSAPSIDEPDVWELWAYDVDTDTWTEIGAIGMEDDRPCCHQTDLLGYSPQLDRLILVTSYKRSPATLLVDPRTGATTIVEDPTTPIIDLVWPNHAFGQAGGTVHVYMAEAKELRSFDAESLAWVSTGVPDAMPDKYRAFAVIADDSINDRILLINGIHGNWWADATRDIWALDLDTGDGTLILTEHGPDTP